MTIRKTAWGTIDLSIILAHATAAPAQEQRPSIFVGPQLRDGFLDVDTGIRDSIRDSQQEFQQGTVRLTQN